MDIKKGADVSHQFYDVVIVGAGISGSILAKSLSQRGHSVLVLEAGTGESGDFAGYMANVDRFYATDIKVPNSPYRNNPNAPQPDVFDVKSNNPADNSRGYFKQDGPLPFKSDYTRSIGGTTLHWLGTCLRMLPDDFKTQSLYGVGSDWPISYQDLEPYYRLAEREIGVSAEIEDQVELAKLLGEREWFDPEYVFPMHRIPLSYVDTYFRDRLTQFSIDYAGRPYPVRVTSTPQGRNSMPNANYPGGYTPVGAVGNPELGQRCQGNSSCVPICPVQAKYNSLKSLDAAFQTGRVTIVAQAVAAEIQVDPSGEITGITYKAYESPDSPAYQTYTAHGKHFVLAANPVENAKLLLTSKLGGEAVGHYLMDHPVMLTWGLTQERQYLGTFRGPGSTSGIESLRTGAFRSQRAPFRVEIDNWGWNWSAIAPWSTVEGYVKQGIVGQALRDAVYDNTQRQVRLGWEFECPPEWSNTVTIDPNDPNGRDRLGNFRPVIRFDLPDYVKAAMAEAKRTSDAIFDHLGITDYTNYVPNSAGWVEWQGQGYVYQGAGHFVGGHVMGNDPRTSVVNAQQRAWEHPNLWLVGCGNMVTEGTSNPTLTMAALTLMAAENIHKELRA